MSNKNKQTNKQTNKTVPFHYHCVYVKGVLGQVLIVVPICSPGSYKLVMGAETEFLSQLAADV